MNKQSWSRSGGFLLFFAYCIALALLAFHHEPWRDELQAFLISKNSHSVSELVQNYQYEGHTMLWFITLYLLKQLSASYAAMTIFHVLLACGSCWLILFHAPFTRTQKLLLIFSYFLFYEYGVIARNYAYAVLFLFLFCSVYTSSFRYRYFLGCLCLVMLAQTSFYGVILSIALTWVLLFDFKKESISPVIKTGGLLLVAASVLLSFEQFKPPADSGYATGWTKNFDLNKLEFTLSLPWRSLFPIPELKLNFWNSNILQTGTAGKYAMMALSVMIIYICFTKFKKHRSILLAFFTTLAAVLFFSYFKYAGYLRHSGHIFLCLIACFWLLRKRARTAPVRFLNPTVPVGHYFLNSILICQFIGSAIAFYYDWNHPFSNAKAAADFIKEKKAEGSVLVISFPEYIGVAVSGHLGQPIYYPLWDTSGTFLVWNSKYLLDISFKDAYQKSIALGQKQNKEVIFLLMCPPDTANYPLTHMAAFPPSIVHDEQFVLYKVRK